MLDIFISYARSTEREASRIEELLRLSGYEVWRDDELPAHVAYTDVIEERLRAAKAVLVVWSAEAVKSQWVRAEAEVARVAGTLVQVTLDGAPLPLPFSQIQCADLSGWTGAPSAHGWRQVIASLEHLAYGAETTAGESPAQAAPPKRTLDERPSIAVLPFANLSGDPEQDYFVDGMVVEIAEALSRIKSVLAIASSSTLSLKGKGLAPQEAARALGATYVVEGSVRKSGGRVRIAVELIDAANVVQIWTHRFEDTLEDVFALQDSVALSVAAVIEPKVEAAEAIRAAARPTRDTHSYDLVLQAMAHSRSFSREGMLQAVGLFERAIALDPDNSVALSRAAAVRTEIDIYNWSDDPVANRREGAALALRALKTSSEDSTVFANVAFTMAHLDRDLTNAQALAERAVSLNPGCSYAWMMCGVVRLRAGRGDLGVEALEMSMRLDPIGPYRHVQLVQMGLGRFEQGRYEEAVACSRDATQIGDDAAAHAIMAASCGRLGDVAAGRSALARFQELSPIPVETLFRRGVNDPATVESLLSGIAAIESGRSDRRPIGSKSGAESLAEPNQHGA